MKKNKTILIKIDESMYNEYRKICEYHSINMSQQIRNFIKNEILKVKENGNIFNDKSNK